MAIALFAHPCDMTDTQLFVTCTASDNFQDITFLTAVHLFPLVRHDKSLAARINEKCYAAACL